MRAMSSRAAVASWAGVLAIALGSAGCNAIAGINEPFDRDAATGGNNGGSGTDVSAFVATWICQEHQTITINGKPTNASANDVAVVITANANGIQAGQSCPISFTVSGTTATLEPGQSCLDSGGNTITSTGGTITVDGKSLTASLTFDVALAAGGTGSEVVTYACTTK